MKKSSLHGLKNMTLLDYIKLLVLFGVAFILIVGFKIDYSVLLNLGFLFIVLFLIGSFYCFIDACNEERKVIINIWKLYMSVIVLMIILIYAIENNANKLQLEYDKTKLLYDLRTNSNDLNKSFAAYEKTVKKIQKKYEEKELKNTKRLNEKQNKEKKSYVNFYMNFSSMVIIIMTIFSSLWLMIEREEIKKSKNQKSYLDQYKEIVAERKKRWGR